MTGSRSHDAGSVGGRSGTAPATTGERAIEVEGLRLTYGDGTRAVRDLSLAVNRGEVFGLLGPNGAGKTTTIRVLTGRATPDAGRVSVLGIDPTREGVKLRERVGILPEKEEPHSFQTAREYLRFVGLAREMDDRTVDDRIAEWADRLAFREKLDTLGADLSRGQQQKVMVAAAFLHRPDLVFVDEPLANLDPIVQRRVREFLVDYAEDGNTVVVSTHDVEVAGEICTRVGIVDRGELAGVYRADADRDLMETFAADVSTPTGDGATDVSTPTGVSAPTGDGPADASTPTGDGATDASTPTGDGATDASTPSGDGDGTGDGDETGDGDGTGDGNQR